MPPTIPVVISVQGDSNSVENDTVRVTIYSGENARGSFTMILNADKAAVEDLGNQDISVEDGDTVVVTEIGSAIGGTSATVVDGFVDDISIAPTAVAFPSRVL